MPRHPPCALSNLTTKMKMLASTVQFSSYGREDVVRARRRHPTATRGGPSPWCVVRRGRVPHQAPETVNRPRAPETDRPGGRSLRTQQRAGPRPPAEDGPSSTFHPMSDHRGDTCPTTWLWAPVIPRGTPGARMLLRKEVIQPHLPVRLPCYDFVPIASPTFDGSLHEGWATGFGCYRLS